MWPIDRGNNPVVRARIRRVFQPQEAGECIAAIREAQKRKKALTSMVSALGRSVWTRLWGLRKEKPPVAVQPKHLLELGTTVNMLIEADVSCEDLLAVGVRIDHMLAMDWNPFQLKYFPNFALPHYEQTIARIPVLPQDFQTVFTIDVLKKTQTHLRDLVRAGARLEHLDAIISPAQAMRHLQLTQTDFQQITGAPVRWSWSPENVEKHAPTWNVRSPSHTFTMENLRF